MVKAVAGQLELPDMPKREFDPMGFSEHDIARAKADIEECEALIARYPEILSRAYDLCIERIMEAGHAGTRWMGEMLRAWLADTHDGAGFGNGCVAVLMRFVVSAHPWLAGCVTMKPCAIDVVLGMGGAA